MVMLSLGPSTATLKMLTTLTKVGLPYGISHARACMSLLIILRWRSGLSWEIAKPDVLVIPVQFI